VILSGLARDELKILHVSEVFILRSLVARLSSGGLNLGNITKFQNITGEGKVVFVLSLLFISYMYLAMRLAIHKHCEFFSSLSYFHCYALH
jgi:hypothetical protein